MLLTYPEYNNMGIYSAGFDFITSTGGSGGYPDFAYGLYKVTNSVSNKCFYLDYRDFRIGYYSSYSPPTYGHNIDLWIKYKYDEDAFYFSSTDNDSDYHLINNRQLLNFWDIKQKGTSLTHLFPNFWENALAIIPSTEGSHPRLVWGPFGDPDNVYINGYKIYRALTSNTIPLPIPSFALLATVNSGTFSYLDEDFSLGGPNIIYYKITATYFPAKSEALFESSPTNTVSISGGIYKTFSSDTKDFKFNLYENYPNPFNPFTEIRYSIAENSFVTLKIYDLLGKEIKELVNEEKKPGIYSESFNGQNFSSGIYFYKLQTNSFTQMRKMILMK